MNALIEQIAGIPDGETFGRATAEQGLLMEAARTGRSPNLGDFPRLTF